MPLVGNAAYATTSAVAEPMFTLVASSGTAANTNLVTSSTGGNTLVWQVWNEQYMATLTTMTTALSTATATITNTWTAWNEQYIDTMNRVVTAAGSLINQPLNASTVATANTIVWTVWNEQLTNLRNASEEQVRAAQQRGEQQRREYARLEAERVAAKDRAERLLRESLSPAQREELQTKGHFHLELISKDGQRKRYRIERGRSRNVRQVDDNGRILRTLCAHPVAMVPDADTMLAQKLMLESAEEEFLRIANFS